VLSISASFEEKNATVRYVPGKVTIDQIVARYDTSGFHVTPTEPIVTITRLDHVTVRGWSERTQFANKSTASTQSESKSNDEDIPKPIRLFVELLYEDDAQVAADPEFSLADNKTGLEFQENFEQVDLAQETPVHKPKSSRFAATIYETVTLSPGETVVPVKFEFTTKGEADSENKDNGQMQIVLRTAPKPITASSETGVALIGSTIELRLGHLCDQKGCVQHLHESLNKIDGLGAVRPFPDQEQPRATLFLRQGQAVDVWNLRKTLRESCIEVREFRPNDLSDYRLRVELPRTAAAQADGANNESVTLQQCASCRDRVFSAIEDLDWATDVVFAGVGINLRPKDVRVDLIALLDAITHAGSAPTAVWLVPRGASIPKSIHKPQPRLRAKQKTDGSQSHPVVEFDLLHTCEVGVDLMSMLNKQKWASQAQVQSGEMTIASAAIADRQYANLTPLLNQLQAAGHTPRRIRLRDFGDVRIELEFAHICGDVKYSKTPKPKKKTPDEEKKEEKPKKPFVPKPIAPAESSNGRKAIKAAIESVDWIKGAVFLDYHTRFEFRSVRRVRIAFQASGEDVVRLDKLISALRHSGFPPKSVIVSRLFPGIPFAKPLPGDLELISRNGTKETLALLKKPERPLAFAFVSLKGKKRKEYKAMEPDPKYYEQLGKTIEEYKDRVDFVAVVGNADEKFEDVAEFWEKTGLPVSIFDDVDGRVRSVFNSQATPAPHMYVFDANGLFRYAGDPHDNWDKPDKEKDDYLSKALDLVLAGEYKENGSVFFNKSVCNCSHPGCKCPKCGCGPSCRCLSKH